MSTLSREIGDRIQIVSTEQLKVVRMLARVFLIAGAPMSIDASLSFVCVVCADPIIQI